MRYRIDDLAARAGVSVDTVRFYQSRGLLAPPEKEGRVAWYSKAHLDRLGRIRELKDSGFTLASINRLLSGDFDEADRVLVEALTGSVAGRTADHGEEWLTLDELARRTGVSPSLLEAIEREGLISATEISGDRYYTASDAGAVAAGLELLGAGLPLSELLALAREHDQAMRVVAREAVELFLRFVRDPIRASAGDEQEASAQLVDAFYKMLPATTSLVAHHFQRVLLAEALARVEQEGAPGEIEAVREQRRKGFESAWPR